jgi:hydrogenase maturation protein HypF
LLRIDGARCERLGHLAPLSLPGGDAAAREPWRMAAAVVHALGRGKEIAARFADEPAAAMVAQMLERGINCPRTSSAGRLFDAAAGLLGVRRRQSFEGQAAMLLEGLAARHGPVEALADGWRLRDGVLDVLPFMAHLDDCEDAAAGAAWFHATLAAALVDWVSVAAESSGIRRVAAGGGCLLNRRLLTDLQQGLHARGLSLYVAQTLPPNDGGLSVGQAWVASRTGV